MPKSSVSDQHHATFESIRQADKVGNEFWSARQLARVLEYSEYRHFLPVIGKAREACQNSQHAVADHFEDVLDMVEIGSGAQRRVAGQTACQIPAVLGLMFLFDGYLTGQRRFAA